MSDATHNNTTTTTTRDNGGNSGLAFIVGILVVVVAVLAYVVFAGDIGSPAADGGGADLNITVQSDGDAAPAADAAPDAKSAGGD
ncbi:hypothetical protein [Antarctobacter heliothermus]|uniref:Uncharacterized protein n=1 Tax=Antarctobacter heliothermus TaxID=74033 RepID=A0A239H5G9_9RHOB|nr:hypothetical protein [Antarctobacter heliothermus]SNS76421.1 hypothetical protein SAMN04488078_103112 [Antarctobacter heliothermus]